MNRLRSASGGEAAAAASHFKEEGEFWLNNLSAPFVKSFFPYDSAGSAQQQSGAEVKFTLSGELLDTVLRVMNRSEFRLHMILTANLVLMLRKYMPGHQGDIIVGAPVLKQDTTSAETFVNTVLPLRVPLDQCRSFKELMLSVRETVVNATRHQNYPLEVLLNQLAMPFVFSGQGDEFPLFDTAVLLENIHRIYDIRMTRPNMILSFCLQENMISGRIVYNPSRYRKETVEGIARHYVQLLQNSMKDVNRPLHSIPLLSLEEKIAILDDFNATSTAFPNDISVHELFDRMAQHCPGKIAVVVEEHMLTYGELERRANQLAQYLTRDRKVQPEECIGVMMDKSVDLIVAVLAVLKAGAVYVPIDFNFPETMIKNMIDDAAVGIVISRKRHVRALNRLQWDCPSFHTFLCMDTESVYAEEETEKSELMGRKLWEYVGEKATDEITGGGWLSSYTGLPIANAEMDEYGDNILKKLTPLLHKEMKILEIGCASGISMYRIAPLVGLYFGTDLSGVIIEKNRQRNKDEGHNNIRLARMAAHEIDQIEEDNFDLVIINSVIQCFHGHNYLRRVLARAVDKLADQGYLFLGDLMDQDLKPQLIADLSEFKHKNRGKEYKTKLDWSVELFISRNFLLDLRVEMPVIGEASFSEKIYTIENELTRFRYDALLTVNKIAEPNENQPVKHKYQHDLRDVMNQESAVPVVPHDPRRLAYIMYTSGSTGRPKGVMVEHPSIVRLVKNTNYVEFPPTGKILQTGALSFDASTFEIWGSLLNGMTLVLMSKEKLLTPEELKLGILNYGITTIFMTTALFNQLSERDISIFAPLKNLLVGGDVASPVHFNRVLEELPNVNFIHCYGPTENTTFSTTYPVKEKHSGHIPIGGPISNSTAYILDAHRNLAPVGCAGELYVGGDGLARGYLNNQELTAQRFIHYTLEDEHLEQTPNAAGQQSPAGVVHPASFTMYKTGDLARWMANGNIHFLGRIDTQVKIRGFRIELEEIENRLLEIDGVVQAVVIARGVGSGMGENKDICAYYVSEAERSLESSEIREYLAQRLPEFMVPAFLVPLKNIPLTPNGKVDRRALPEPVIEGSENLAQPRTPLQKRLVELWAGVLDREPHTISIDDNFFECGGHSLKATVLVTKIHQALDVKIPLAEIFRLPTVGEMAAYIEKHAGHWQDKHYAVLPAELKEYYPLTSAQMRLYILSNWDPTGLNYNIPMAMNMSGALDRERLEQVFQALVRRHESFRTAFIKVDSRPMQRIFPTQDIHFELEHFDFSALPEKEQDSRSYDIISHTFVRPFDLAAAPLLRVGLITLSAQHHVLMVDMHHSISDGTSLRVLLGEFAVLYGGGELPELKLQYRDFALWRAKQSRSILTQQQSFWLDRFSGEIPVLNLPYDFPRPAMQSFAGGFVDFQLDAEETAGLRRLSSKEGVTLFISLLAIFNVLLSKLSGQEDIVVGTPVAGRRHADLHHIVGMFVNTLTFRNFPAPGKTFRQFLEEVKSRTLTAFDNQEYPFEELVERLHVNRDTGRNPLFDVMFALHNMELVRGFIPDAPAVADQLQLTPYPFQFEVSKFDLTFHGSENDDTISFTVEYCTQLFTEPTILEFINYFRKVIQEVLLEPGTLISDIDVLDTGQKSAILEFSNGPALAVDPSITLSGRFARQAENTPDHAAVVNMAENICDPYGNLYLTYKELNRRALLLAGHLLLRGAGQEDVIALMVERSSHLILSIIAIIHSGAAFLAIDPELPDSRKRFMLEDAHVRILLTDDTDESHLSFVPSGVDIIDVHKKELYPAEGNTPDLSLPEIHGSNLLYVIYTSGSTGKPKGLMIEHRNIVNLMEHQFQKTNVDYRRVMQFTTIVFDVAVQEIFSALLSGGIIYLISRELRGDVFELFRRIESRRISTLFLPMAFLKMIFSQPDYIQRLPRCIRHIQTAGEQVVISGAFRQFLQQNHIYLHNHYGPAETHVVTTYTLDPASDIPKLPPIGKPVINTSIAILDPSMRLVPKGVPGELVAAGHQVGRGYLNNPALTREKFVNNIQVGMAFKGVAYRTGDLARWLADGNIEFLGRIDSQVKIRGFRIEMGEIESRLLNHPGIKEAAVKAITAGTSNDNQLCAYITAHEDTRPDELRQYLSDALPDYMVPAHFVYLEGFPLTASGKIDRNALPMPALDEIAGADIFEEPQGPVEAQLLDLWSSLLDLPAAQIGVHHNFFNIGGQSLKATIMVSKIHKALNVKIRLTDIFRYPTIRQLAGLLKEKARITFAAIPPVEEKDYYPCSSAQKRLYFISQVDTVGTGYNMPQATVLEEGMDEKRLNDAFIQLIQRHESLRTSFTMVKGEPVQRVHRQVDFKLNSLGSVSNLDSFVVPFDLSRAPLLRAGVVSADNHRRILLIDMHHIITDGVSHAILNADFLALYRGESLSPLRIQYKDFTVWRSGPQGKRLLTKQKEYWLDSLSGEIPVLELPYDFPRPVVQSFEGDLSVFRFDLERTRALKKMAAARGATLYMILFALFHVLLSRLSGQEDVIAGTPVSGREHNDLLNVIGMFVNTLAIRSRPAGHLTFQRFLDQVKDNVLAAFENQGYPLEDIVEQLPLNRDTGRNPLFDVVFALQDTAAADSSEAGEEELASNTARSSKFDLTFNAVETGSGLVFSIEYCTRLFKVETIQRLFQYFDTISQRVLNHPTVTLASIDFLDEQEKHRLLYEFNDPFVQYPRDKSIDALLAQQVRQTPDRVAVVGEYGHYRTYLTYKQLHSTSDVLSRRLLDVGVVPGEIVAIMADHNPAMMVGILAILKARAAYMPVNKNYPLARKAYVMKDAAARILLTDGDCQDLDIDTVIRLDQVDEPPVNTSEAAQGQGTDLAYVMYTSGSTGLPKGTLVTHRNVIRLVKNTHYITWDNDERLMQTGALEFDASTFEIWGALLNGHRVYPVDREVILRPSMLKEALKKDRISTLFMTTALFNQILEKDISVFAPLRNLLVGGDVASPLHFNRFLKEVPGTAFIHCYGPTENTTFSTTYPVRGEHSIHVPIGRPVTNSTAYILDRSGNLLPTGCAGELCVGGEGVALGYLNRPELTADKFVLSSFTINQSPLILYKTGDLARYLADGNIQFLGRIDHQVKIRGFRVELEEIENRLLDHPAINQAVVMAQSIDGSKILNAYIVAGATDKEALTVSELREYMARHLPDYMIPSHFFLLDKIPLTSNGKIDRSALTVVSRSADDRLATGTEYAAPRTGTELKLADIWKEVLQVEKPGLYDNFFDLGGTSMTLLKLNSRLKEEFDRDIPIVSLFQYSTIDTLAGFLDTGSEESEEQKAKHETIRRDTISRGKNRIQRMKRNN